MSKLEGEIEEIDRQRETKKGKKYVVVKVNGRYFYDWGGMLGDKAVAGDYVEVDFVEGNWPKLTSISKIPRSRQSELGEKNSGGDNGTPSQEYARSSSAEPQNRVNYSLRQTALNCASALISNEIFKVPTGVEGVTALAEKLEAYLLHGHYEEDIKPRK